MGFLKDYRPNPLDVIVLHGHWWNPMFWVIMVRTTTFWEHAVTVRSADGSIFDARADGVNIHNLKMYEGRYAAVLRRRDILSIPQVDKIKMIAWGDKLVAAKNGYDFIALFGFLTGIKYFNDDDRWYCAEVAPWMFSENNWPIFNGVVKFIFPSDLYRCRVFDIVLEGVL